MKNLIGYALLLLSLYLGVCVANDFASELITKNESGITYATGGIGEDQQRALKALRKDFNLQLTFAEKATSTYLADVDITIQNMSGTEVIELNNTGPILLTQLEPGKYRVEAKSGDKTQTKTVTVNKKGIKDLYFYW